MNENETKALELSDEKLAKAVGGGAGWTSLNGYNTSSHFCNSISPTQVARANSMMSCCGICTHYHSESNSCDAGKYPNISL